MPETAKTTTLSVRMEIQVDPAEWRSEYGSTGNANDVESYLLNTLQQCPAAEAGCFTITGYAVQEA